MDSEPPGIGKECDPDCCICISLNYGKQQVMKLARCKESTYSDKYPYEGFPNRRETIMIDKERPKYFKTIDIGLRSGDSDWHSPLLVTCKLDAIRNHRTRSSNQIKKRTDHRKELQEKKKRRSWQYIYLTNIEVETLWKPRTLVHNATYVRDEHSSVNVEHSTILCSCWCGHRP